MMTIAALLTCHNRVGKTLACLERLFAQRDCDACSISVYLVDDGSSDGTGESVKRNYPQVTVVYGDGNLYWNRGMHRAFGEALKTGFDYYLWLNDDTLMHEDALSTMLQTHMQLVSAGKGGSIIVASTRDPATGAFTYGGYVSKTKAGNPLHLKLQPPGPEPLVCVTMCGNCVLIPKEVADRVGNIDPVYLHRWGDVDYGLRARAAQCECWIAPGYIADCPGNPGADRQRDRSLPFSQRLTELHSLKGLGKEDWLRFVRTHGGPLWMTIWVRPYLRLVYNTFR